VVSAAAAWHDLRALVLDRFDRRAEVTAAALGLSFARVRAVLAVADEPLPMRELATRLAADPPYVTLIVDDLQARGLVDRRPHPADRAPGW
jgi:DNA-binding MarR family transcriptional regulator